MQDRAGNELQIGDKVLFLVPGTSTSWLEWGEVVRFTPKMVEVKYTQHGREHVSLRSNASVVKPFKE